MIDQSLMQVIAHWGYYLLPKAHPSSPGYSGLLVAIREIPTQRHYDPEAISIRLWDQGDAAWTVLKLHSSTLEPRQVMAGRVVLSDRVDKRVQFFTFGGSLEMNAGLRECVYALRSAAPILVVTGFADGIPDLITAETEMLIGKLQIKSGMSDERMARWSPLPDPVRLYHLSLQSILERYQHQSALRQRHHNTYEMLVEEQRWLMSHGQWQLANGALGAAGEKFSPN